MNRFSKIIVVALFAFGIMMAGCQGTACTGAKKGCSGSCKDAKTCSAEKACSGCKSGQSCAKCDAKK